MSAKSISHEEATVKSLQKDWEFALAYLADVFKDGDLPEILTALRRVVEAYGGVKRLAGESGLNEKSLHRTLSEQGNPTLKSLLSIGKALGIALTVEPTTSCEPSVNYALYPLAEMMKAGWIPKCNAPLRKAKELITAFVKTLGLDDNNIETVPSYRKSRYASEESDPYALKAWLWGVMYSVKDTIPSLPVYDRGKINQDFLTRIARLSREHDGINRVAKELNAVGVAFAVVPHLKKTYLDGAVFLYHGHPVVVLTLRYDRIDSFWFTLLHELAHIHLGHVEDEEPILDNLYGAKLKGKDSRENDADTLAMESEIPSEIWKAHEADLLKGKIPVMYEVADQLGIHNAIVAGRIRHETGKWNLLAQHVGRGFVRKAFPKEFPVKA